MRGISASQRALLATVLLGAGACSWLAARAPAPRQASWPLFGGTIHRNMASPDEKNILNDFCVQKGKEKNIKWAAQLGSISLGGPVIAGGRIFIGTNNDNPRDPNIKGDKGVLMCFRESDGKFLWQATHDKLPYADDMDPDPTKRGVVSTPVVDGNRVYYVSNRGELLCADVEGDQEKHQAKILWRLDMIKELGVNPCYPFCPNDYLPCNAPLVVDDLVCTLTANGVNYKGKVVAPEAPSFVAVNKHTGKVVWQDNSPGKNIMGWQGSNACAAEVHGRMQAIVPGGDGWLRGFEAQTGKLLWKFDCNPKASVFKPGGRGDRGYPIGTPVFHDNKVYVAVGRVPQNGDGVGHLWCIDVSKKPANKDLDLSPVNDDFDPKSAVNKDSGLVWHYGGPVLPKPRDNEREFIFGRTVSTVAVHDGLVYAAELDCYLHCLDAKTGKKYWDYDLKDMTLNNSPYYVDGKVFLGTGNGYLCVFAHGKQLKEPTKIDLDDDLKLPPVAVNGVLYINTGSTLYAIAPR
jgi:outer membrane protein assembly factor BamB